MIDENVVRIILIFNCVIVSLYIILTLIKIYVEERKVKMVKLSDAFRNKKDT